MSDVANVSSRCCRSPHTLDARPDWGKVFAALAEGLAPEGVLEGLPGQGADPQARRAHGICGDHRPNGAVCFSLRNIRTATQWTTGRIWPTPFLAHSVCREGLTVRKRTWALLTVVGVGAVALSIPVVYYNTPVPGVGEVTGRYWAVDDTGLPDRPLSDETFLVIPGATVADIWPEDATHDYSHFEINQRVDGDDLVATYGASVVEVQPNGRFRVDAPPGPTIICLGSLTGVDDCSELDLYDGASLRATWGEGGFGIWVE